MAPFSSRPFAVVLVEPEIPQNVGAIARTCAAYEIPLHLVGARHIDFSAAALRRAGVDTWSQVELYRHRHLRDVLQICAGRPLAFTRHAASSLAAFSFASGDLLVFGRESDGLNEEELALCSERLVIEQSAGVRSLNIAVSVGVACYAAHMGL